MDEEYNALVESQVGAIRDMNLDELTSDFLVQEVTKIMTQESYIIDTKIDPKYFCIIAEAISKTRTLKTLGFYYKSLDNLEETVHLAIFLQALQENDSITTVSLFSLWGAAKKAHINSLLNTFSLMKKLEQLKGSTEDFSDINLLSIMHIDHIKTLRFLGPIKEHQQKIISQTFVRKFIDNSYIKAFPPPSLSWYVSFRQGDIPLDDWKTLVRLYKVVDPRYPDSKVLFTPESVTEYIEQSKLPFFDAKVLPQDITDVVGGFLKLSDVKLDDNSFPSKVTSNIIQANPTSSASHYYGLATMNLIESYHSVKYIFDQLLGFSSDASHYYGLDAMNLIESYHSVKYIFDKILGFSSDSITISPQVRSVLYTAASAWYYSSKDLSIVTKITLPMFVGSVYYAKEKMYDSIYFNQDMNPVIKCGIYNAVMLGGKSPLYYVMMSNPLTSSYGGKMLLSDISYSTATCVNVYFDKSNHHTLESQELSILMSVAIAYNSLDSGFGMLSNALLAINSFASAHIMLNTMDNFSMNMLQGLTNYFVSEEQTDFA